MTARERMVRVVAEALGPFAEASSLRLWPVTVVADAVVDALIGADALDEARRLALAELARLTAETPDHPLTCDCGRHLPCRHCEPEKNTDVVSPAHEPPIAPRAGSVRLAGCSEEEEGKG